MEGKEEMQSNGSEGRRARCEVFFLTLGIDEAAQKFKETYLKED